MTRNTDTLTTAQTRTFADIVAKFARYGGEMVNANEYRAPTLRCIERAGLVVIRENQGSDRLWSANARAGMTRYWTTRDVTLTATGRALAATL